MSAKSDIAHGNAYPFDAPDAWWHGEGRPSNAPAPKDWAHRAARGIIANLEDRQGIKHELAHEKIDEGTRAEIVAEMAAIIRAAAPKS